MNSEDYTRIAKMTMKEDNPASRLVNAALGLAGEAGEVCDHLKKNMFHGHALDTDHLVKELGDIQWYIVQACEALGVTLDEVMRKNNTKLLARYKQGFNEHDSINREEYVGTNNT